MKRNRILIHASLVATIVFVLAGCVEREAADDNGAADRPVPTPEATETPPAEPDLDPTPDATPESPENGEWYELLITDKTYPEEEIGEEILELAENEDEFQELWDWFQLEGDDDHPAVDWDSQVVLFAGTGESSGCPLILEDVTFDEEERFIAVAATRDVPEDTMCTMDWTPRVFVIALDTEMLGDGELRAGIYDTDAIDGIPPDDGEIVR
jgi:hypothetical protein